MSPAFRRRRAGPEGADGADGADGLVAAGEGTETISPEAFAALGDAELAEDDVDEEVVDAAVQEELAEEEVERRAARAPRFTRPATRPPGALRRLYRGETSFPFVERRRWWLLISSIVIVAGVVSLGVRGLNLGITFRGGTAWTVAAPGISQAKATSVVESAGLSQPTVALLGTGARQHVQVQADLNSLSAVQQRAETTRVIDALAHMAHVVPNQVSVTNVGPTWGSQVTERAVIALVAFLALVAVYISIRFEPKMAVAAFVALLHDLLVTAGVYSLAGFQVTPDTVIAVLTILGYSLYDTVVVFDRVRDNAKGLGSSGRLTYSEMVDLSMNQTLARSINTSAVAILPVLSVLLIGAELLGATTLQNYGLALVVGLLSGAYSSIFIASPILAALKEREPRYAGIRQRLEAKGERLGLLTPSAAAALAAVGSGGGGGGGRPAARKGGKGPARPGTLRPGQAGGKGRSPGAPEPPAGVPSPAQGRLVPGGGASRTAAPGSAARVVTATTTATVAARTSGGGAAGPAGAGAGDTGAAGTTATVAGRNGGVSAPNGGANAAARGGAAARRPTNRPRKSAKGKRRR